MSEAFGVPTPEQVFKIQRPLYASNGNYQEVLIYNEDKSIQCQLKLGMEQLILLFFDPENEEILLNKVYVNARVCSNGMLDIKEVIHPTNEPYW